jgi:putative ABC transport system permease protein
VGVFVSIWSGKLLWASLAGVLQGLMGSVTFDVDVSPDARVLVFGAVLSASTTFLFGLAPAFASTRIEINVSLKPARQRLGWLLLGAQLASVVVLLSLAGNLGSSVRKSRIADIGFDAQDVYMTNFIYSSETVDPKIAKRRLLQRLATIPGVDSVAVGDVPMWNGKQQPMDAGSVKHYACLVSYGSGNYLETLRLPILRGRSFTQAEAERDAPVAVVSEFTARLYWPNQDPIGKRFSLGSDSRTSFEVIGVARNVRFNDLSEPDELHVYLPSMEKNSGGFLFRIRGDRQRALEAVRAEISNIDPQLLPALILVSLEDGPFRIFRSYLRVFAVFTGTLTALSLTLAVIGIYGVMSFLVGQRTKELGIRMALGATSRGVIRSVLVRGLPPVLMGMAAGFITAGALAAWLDHMEKEFPQPLLQEFFADPAAYAELAFILAVALLASIVPARRATRVDPVMALRHE